MTKHLDYKTVKENKHQTGKKKRRKMGKQGYNTCTIKWGLNLLEFTFLKLKNIGHNPVNLKKKSRGSATGTNRGVIIGS